VAPDDYVVWYREVAASIASVLAGDGSYFLNIKEHAEDGQRHLYVKDLFVAHVRQWGWRFVDAGLLGCEDGDQRSFAVKAGRVVVTKDADFLRLHAQGVPHAGIAYRHSQSRGKGEALRRLLLIHDAFSPEDMKNRVEDL